MVSSRRPNCGRQGLSGRSNRRRRRADAAWGAANALHLERNVRNLDGVESALPARTLKQTKENAHDPRDNFIRRCAALLLSTGAAQRGAGGARDVASMCARTRHPVPRHRLDAGWRDGRCRRLPRKLVPRRASPAGTGFASRSYLALGGGGRGRRGRARLRLWRAITMTILRLRLRLWAGCRLGMYASGLSPRRRQAALARRAGTGLADPAWAMVGPPAVNWAGRSRWRRPGSGLAIPAAAATRASATVGGRRGRA